LLAQSKFGRITVTAKAGFSVSTKDQIAFSASFAAQYDMKMLRFYCVFDCVPNPVIVGEDLVCNGGRRAIRNSADGATKTMDLRLGA
jgi:hypothetical protein